MMLDLDHAAGGVLPRERLDGDAQRAWDLRGITELHVRDDVHLRAIDHRSSIDRALVLTILREYFSAIGGPDPVRRYRWLYLENPHGIARTYAAIAKTGAPVAVTSLFPRQVQVGSRVLVGAIGGDAYVTPRFRRRGLATDLHRLALASMDDGLSFMFGPPEPNNLRALLTAGSTVTGAVRRYTRPLRIRPIGNLLRHGVADALSRLVRAPASSLRVERLEDGHDRRVDIVWRRVADRAALDDSVVPVRDATFYEWRFGRSITRRQHAVVVSDGAQPIAVGAIERRGPRAAIVDVTTTPDDLRHVLSALIFNCREADAIDLQIHVPSRRREAVVASLGFIPRTKKLFQVQAPAWGPDRHTLTRADAWDYTWGDGDVDCVL